MTEPTLLSIQSYQQSGSGDGSTLGTIQRMCPVAFLTLFLAPQLCFDDGFRVMRDCVTSRNPDRRRSGPLL